MNTTTHALPKDMALVETGDGTLFPVFAPRENPRWICLVDPPLMPAALDLFEDSEHGYTSRQAAVDACHAWHEAATLMVHWHLLAAVTEVHPERTDWYCEEIQHISRTREIPTITAVGSKGFAMVIVVSHGFATILHATGTTPDEAMEALYQRVSTFMSAEENRALPRAS